MTAHPTHRHPSRSDQRPARIDLWSVALLFLAVVWLAVAFFFMARNHSSPLFLVPAVAVGMYAIINLRD